MAKRDDSGTIDLFEMPISEPTDEGTMDFDIELRHVLAQMVKESRFNRYEIASRVSQLAGKDISTNQIDSWTAPSRQGWNFPFYLAPAFEQACESYLLTHWLANKRQGKVLFGREVLVHECAKKQLQKEQLHQEIRRIKTKIGDIE